jgi:hypothetical protein
MLDSFLVPAKTAVSAKGDSDPIDVSPAATSTFLITLSITKVVEQEAIDLSVFTSIDGATCETKPIASLPQKFYVGEYPLLIDLSQLPGAKLIRVHWEVNRWGRGSTTPNFEIGVRVREVPRETLAEAISEARSAR